MKTLSIDFTENIPVDVFEFHKKFKEAGKVLYLVGGCVRDLVRSSRWFISATDIHGYDTKVSTDIIGHINDFDMVTDAFPDEIESIMNGYDIDFQGKHFGVMRVNTPSCKKGYEIATYREDITPGRKPIVRIGSTMENDSMRRDFCINAMYYDIENQMVLDPTEHGIEDLTNGLISTPGKPSERMNEDKLRVLRAVRFSCRIRNGRLSIDLEKAIKEDNKLEGPDGNGNIVPISRERIVEEFIKGIEQSKENYEANTYIKSLHDLGLLYQIFDGIININSQYHPIESGINLILHSDSIETLIATILSYAVPHDRKSSEDVARTMTDILKFPDDISSGVKMLLDMRWVDSNTAYALRKYMNRTELDIKDICDFARKFSDYNQIAFVAYITMKNDLKNFDMETNTGEQLMREGFKPGPEMGMEQSKRESSDYDKILNYVIRNEIKDVYQVYPGITKYKK